MSEVPTGINHVSDTAFLIAGCRAVESERPDALIHDPFAARLAGDRGIGLFRALRHPEIMGFGMAVRTRFIDELICNVVGSAGIATVVSVGAGLDTRPWRLDLPAGLRWIEIDFSAVLDYKEQLLAREKLCCRRERLPVDLNDPSQREQIFASVGPDPALTLTEGLLMYLPARTVQAFATESHQRSGITHWISDVVTDSFSKAIGGGGTSVVSHVQAEDHLTGEEILQTISSKGWRSAATRSYIRDLGFATERIAELTATPSGPSQPPAFDPDDPSGVHLFVHS